MEQQPPRSVLSGKWLFVPLPCPNLPKSLSHGAEIATLRVTGVAVPYPPSPRLQNLAGGTPGCPIPWLQTETGGAVAVVLSPCTLQPALSLAGGRQDEAVGGLGHPQGVPVSAGSRGGVCRMLPVPKGLDQALGLSHCGHISRGEVGASLDLDQLQELEVTLLEQLQLPPFRLVPPLM